MAESVDRVDIAIIGAGPVGMTLALALAGAADKVLLIDSRRRGAWAADPRALARSHGTRQIPEHLGAWNAEAATAIETIHVSQRGGFGRTLLMARDYDIPALGYVMRYRELAAALDAQLDTSRLLNDSPLIDLRSSREGTAISLASGADTRRFAARLVVHAEGTPGNDAEITVRDYRQHAVVAEVRPAGGHAHRAWERFTPDGPLALLPLAQDYSVVFSVPPDQATQLLQIDDDGFLAALHAHFGGRVRFTAAGPRARFPLALRIRQQLTATRQVWIGNAAQSLHPVSGQGFNLGLRDAWELAQTLLASAGEDPGDDAILATYARGRQFDRGGSMAFTDGLVRIFSNDLAPLRFARGLGLLTLDLLPPLRHFVARRMIWGARAWP